MTTIDQIIATSNVEVLSDPDQYAACFEHVLRQLSHATGFCLSWDEEAGLENVTDLARDVRSSESSANLWNLEVRGIISARQQGERLLFAATLFLYAAGSRVQLHTGESFLDLEYDPLQGKWIVVGWFKDRFFEYDEFDDFANT